MDQEARRQDLLAELNGLLDDVTPYRLDIVDPAKIRPVKTNAHYMSKKVFDQLVANVEKDKNLSSLPFCWRDAKGTYICLSGNHRVKAAAGAGVKSILILYTDAALSESEQIAIQLSHNAIVGQDNPTVLKELWTRIDLLDLKVYTGLDETQLHTMEPVQVIQIKEAALRFETLTMLFLPAETERLEEIVKHLGEVKLPAWVGDVSDFDKFFELLITFKETADVLNTGTAFKMIMGIVEDWIAERQAEDEEAADAEI